MKLTIRASESSLTVAAADGTPKREITGVAVPWNIPANASTGPVMFLEGSLPTDGPAPKLIRDHSPTNPIGVVTERVSTSEGMMFAAKISATAAGDEALVLAADGVLDSVSVGVDVQKFHYDGDTLVVESGSWRELSLVPWGAFTESKIATVAASEQDQDQESDEAIADEDETNKKKTEISEEETETMEPITTEATSTTSPIIVKAARRVSASDYISGLVSGNMTPEVRAANGVVSDIPGMIPEPLIGDVFDTLTDERPFIAARGTFAPPAGGESFFRRKVSQHTAVALQVAEFDTLASQKYEVDRIQVDKKFFGGYLDISEQAQSFSEPSMVERVLADMANVYAKTTETYALGQVYDGSTSATAQVSDWTDGDEVIESLYSAAAEIKNGFGRMPSHLIIRSHVWAAIGGAKDSGGNRIFPYLGPSNAAGTLNGATALTGNPLGLALIVSDDFGLVAGDRAAIMLSASAVELYEDRRGAIRVEQPATLSTRLAFRGIFAVADIALSTGSLLL